MRSLRAQILVGRQDELAALEQAWQIANTGVPMSVVVQGEAGIGKTQLVEALLSRVRGTDRAATLAMAHAFDFSGGAIPYGVAAGLVDDLIDAIGSEALTDLGERRAPVATLLAGEEPPQRLALFAAVRRLVTTAAADHLLCLIVEDLQWADQSSIDLLVYLARAVQGTHLLVVATTRTDPSGALAPQAHQLFGSVSSVITLEPLTREEVSEQIHLALGVRTLPAQTIQKIVERADGIPLYVDELVRAAMAGADADRLPAGLGAILTSRAARLSELTQKLLQAAAMDERPSAVRTLAEVTEAPLATVSKALAEGTSAGLLEELSPGRFRFRHELLRRALADATPADARTAWHRAWAETLERDSPAITSRDTTVALAEHWYRAAEPGRALHASVQAGNVALHGAPREAAVQFARALEMWDQAADPETEAGTDRPTLVVLLVDALQSCMDFAAIRGLVQAEIRTRPSGDLVEEWWRQARVASSSIKLGQAVTWPAGPDQVLPMILRISDHPPSRMRLDLAQELWITTRDFGVHRAEIAELITKSAHDIGFEEAALLDLVVDAGLALEDLDLDRAASVWNEAMALAAHTNSRRETAVRQRAMDIANMRGDLPLVEDLGSRTLAEMESPFVDVHNWVDIVFHMTSARFLASNYRGMDDLLATVEDLEVPPAWALAFATWTAMSAAIRGDVARAEQALTRAEDVYSTAREVPATAAFVALERGEMATAQALFLEALRHPQVWTPGDLPIVVNAARCLAGDAPELAAAIHDAAAACPSAGALDTAWQTELAARLATFERQRAIDYWEDAANRWRALGAPYQEALCRSAVAEAFLDDDLLSATDRRAAATAHLERAADLCRQIGAVPAVNRTSEIAARAGISVRSLPTRSHHSGGLTDRELEVLRLVAVGRTNDEIGATLYMSPKTASVHVSRILTKLGAGNRTEAASTARRMGLVD
jgi:DNA-binding CsgD family transcriptional regulator/tetratricopeptide (TPR) repeat protein